MIIISLLPSSLVERTSERIASSSITVPKFRIMSTSASARPSIGRMLLRRGSAQVTIAILGAGGFPRLGSKSLAMVALALSASSIRLMTCSPHVSLRITLGPGHRPRTSPWPAPWPAGRISLGVSLCAGNEQRGQVSQARSGDVEGVRRLWISFADAVDKGGAHSLGGGGAPVPGVGGDHEGAARVERQPVQGEAVDGRVGLVGGDHPSGNPDVPRPAAGAHP